MTEAMIYELAAEASRAYQYGGPPWIIIFARLFAARMSELAKTKPLPALVGDEHSKRAFGDMFPGWERAPVSPVPAPDAFTRRPPVDPPLAPIIPVKGPTDRPVIAGELEPVVIHPDADVIPIKPKVEELLTVGLVRRPVNPDCYLSPRLAYVGGLERAVELVARALDGRCAEALQALEAELAPLTKGEPSPVGNPAAVGVINLEHGKNTKLVQLGYLDARITAPERERMMGREIEGQKLIAEHEGIEVLAFHDLAPGGVWIVYEKRGGSWTLVGRAFRLEAFSR